MGVSQRVIQVQMPTIVIIAERMKSMGRAGSVMNAVVGNAQNLYVTDLTSTVQNISMDAHVPVTAEGESQ